jgi:hypothetical protein
MRVIPNISENICKNEVNHGYLTCTYRIIVNTSSGIQFVDIYRFYMFRSVVTIFRRQHVQELLFRVCNTYLEVFLYKKLFTII